LNNVLDIKLWNEKNEIISDKHLNILLLVESET